MAVRAKEQELQDLESAEAASAPLRVTLQQECLRLQQEVEQARADFHASQDHLRVSTEALVQMAEQKEKLKMMVRDSHQQLSFMRQAFDLERQAHEDSASGEGRAQ